MAKIYQGIAKQSNSLVYGFFIRKGKRYFIKDGKTLYKIHKHTLEVAE